MTTTLLLTDTDLITDGDPLRSPDEAQLAAAAFQARYSGRTLEAYRHGGQHMTAPPSRP